MKKSHASAVNAVRTLMGALWGAVLLTAPCIASTYGGRVVDVVTKKPIENAFITLRDVAERTDDTGAFHIEGDGMTIGVRAIGYARSHIAVTLLQEAGTEVPLTPFQPKAVYLSFFGIGDKRLRERVLELIEDTELNALVIDVKGDNGKIPYESSIALAAAVGAQKPRTIKDIKALITAFRERGIYTIARIVVFKDPLLALAKPDWAVKTGDGSIWRDRENLPWTDPFREEVWRYNIDVAVEAAQSGFDEIQFDYVRFPDASGLAYSRPCTQECRIEAINGFLTEARKRLLPYNVFLSADLFGYVCWNLNDTKIGQQLEKLAPVVDYVSPMLYPSSFQFGIPGYRVPVKYPYEIVYLSLQRALQRTGLPSSRFRPWLQAFKDYGFDRRTFTGKEIRAQIQSAEDFGSDGWMLWNPHNVYSGDGLNPDRGRASRR